MTFIANDQIFKHKFNIILMAGNISKQMHSLFGTVAIPNIIIPNSEDCKSIKQT